MRPIQMLAWRLWRYYVFLSKGARMLRKNLVWVLVRVGELGPIMRIRLDLKEVSLQAEAICVFLSLNQLLNIAPMSWDWAGIFGSRMPGKKFSSFVHPIPMGVGRHKQGVHAGTPSTDAGSGLQKYWYQVLSTRRMKHEKLEDKLNNLR